MTKAHKPTELMSNGQSDNTNNATKKFDSKKKFKDYFNILSQRISGDFMNENDRHFIDFINFNVNCPNVYTHALFPPVFE